MYKGDSRLQPDKFSPWAALEIAMQAFSASSPPQEYQRFWLPVRGINGSGTVDEQEFVYFYNMMMSKHLSTGLEVYKLKEIFKSFDQVLLFLSSI